MKLIAFPALFVLFFVCANNHATSQDTLRVMHYNLLYYGNSAFCTETNNNTTNKDGYLETITEYYMPHIITVNELGATSTLANRILSNALNTNGRTSWQRATISNTVGSNIINMLYYDSDMVELESQETVAYDLFGSQITRDIIFYHMYYVDPNWPVETDTVRFTVVDCHLHSSDAAQREKEAAAIMDRISQNGDGNYFVSGDLNVDASSESSFQEFIAYNPSSLRLYDPVNQLGTWHTNSSYAGIHTQSTHSSGSGCHAGGGLDDRFDFTLVSDEIINATQDIRYISGTSAALGQDGNAYNQSLPVASNQVVPQNVAGALYNMSDHLPVVSAYEVGPDISSVADINRESFGLVVPNPIRANNLAFRIMDANEQLSVAVYDISGRLILKFPVAVHGEKDIDVPVNWDSGVYFLTVSGERGHQKTVRVVQP